MKNEKKNPDYFTDYGDDNQWEIAIFVFLYIVLYILVIVSARSHDVIQIHDAAISFASFTGVFSSLANICLIMMVLYYKKPGFIGAVALLCLQFPIYVQNVFIKKYNLRNGDVIEGLKKRNRPEDKFMALIYLVRVNGRDPSEALDRPKFENLTPVYPDERIRLERDGGPLANRIVDMVSPIGKGQRGMIVSQPKAGKTTLLKSVANAITLNYPKMHIIILLIDERPEEVTDIKESIIGDNVDVIYSTFDEQPEHHKKVSEMVVEHAKRRVEMGQYNKACKGI